MTVQGWTVFNTTAATNVSTITMDTFTSNGTAPYYVSGYEPHSVPEAVARPEEPLDWLRRRVNEMCDLGRLD